MQLDAYVLLESLYAELGGLGDQARTTPHFQRHTALGSSKHTLWQATYWYWHSLV